MTPITKAENKVDALELQISGLSSSNQKALTLAIDKMKELIDVYICRKRKTEKSQIDDLYAIFTDEFNVLYLNITEKIGITGVEI